MSPQPANAAETLAAASAATPGKSFPLGAKPEYGGVSFSVYAHSADKIELLLFDHADDAAPARVIALDPHKNRTYAYWHIHVPGIKPGQIYAYRATGPSDPANGLRFDANKILLDPYGRALAMPTHYDRGAAARTGDDTAAAMKSVVVDSKAYDWEGDTPLQRPFSQTVIYEMHVAGFTKHPSSGVEESKRGTFAGLVQKIPYLKDLGITAVELLPVFQFDAQDAPDGKVNYWGYQPVSFFAPHCAYSSNPDPLGVLDEFRDMVKAFHRAGIEVILDVVFNHTAEGNQDGPTFCWRGFANDIYYILAEDKFFYDDFTGCGNTLNGNHPIVRRMIEDSLHYWVSEMHVDGFRFDLASILARDEAGVPLQNPPVLWDIDSDPILAGSKLIAEAWDAGGLYQVGSFVGDRWKEWNGRFRDDVRAFVRGDEDTVRAMANRLAASPDIYLGDAREPEQSINFVTCHDGFTLNDLVSYNDKHNEANGEGNRDGANDNRSWNGGVEGPTDDADINALRLRQIKNFFAVTLLSVGAPMLLGGDEFRRTQQGNNNAYCQANEISWIDWTLLGENAELHRFVKTLIGQRLRSDRATGMADADLTLNQFLQRAQIQLHGIHLNQPDWSSTSHSIAASARSVEGRFRFHYILNEYWEPLDFEIPAAEAGHPWRLWIDTFRPSPNDIHTWATGPLVNTPTYHTGPRSVVILIARSEGAS